MVYDNSWPSYNIVIVSMLHCLADSIVRWQKLLNKMIFCFDMNQLDEIASPIKLEEQKVDM